MGNHVKYLVGFEDDRALDPNVVGQKFFNLAKATRAGFAVPRAVVVSTAAHRFYITHGTWPDGLLDEISEAADDLDLDRGLSIRSSATLEDLVYAARGLVDWWRASGDARSATGAAALLRKAHARFYRGTHWLDGDLAPLPGSSRSLLIQDSQLPSPAALWIDTAWQLAESENEVQLGRLADTASLVWPQALHDNTFYHATWLAAMIERRARRMAATGQQTAP